jgi:hypothetical protein
MYWCMVMMAGYNSSRARCAVGKDACTYSRIILQRDAGVCVAVKHKRRLKLRSDLMIRSDTRALAEDVATVL